MLGTLVPLVILKGGENGGGLFHDEDHGEDSSDLAVECPLNPFTPTTCDLATRLCSDATDKVSFSFSEMDVVTEFSTN